MIRSLRDLADRALQRSRLGATASGPGAEGNCVFHAPKPVPMPVEQDLPPKSAKNDPCSTVPFPRDGTDGTSELPATMPAGLRSLQSLPCPSGMDPKAWRTSIVDALRIANAGWAEQALALGWSELDLFGAVPDRSGDPDADGLAVKLSGRRVLAMSASFATVREESGGRSYIHRSINEGAMLLWLLGRRGSVGN